jgi:Holliday junction resolvase
LKRPNKVGKEFEYRVRDWFRRAGLNADRVPVSGAAPVMKGDVVVKLPEGKQLVIECKRRTEKYKQILKWLDEASAKGVDLLVLGVGRQKPVVVVWIDVFIDMFLKGRG